MLSSNVCRSFAKLYRNRHLCTANPAVTAAESVVTKTSVWVIGSLATMAVHSAFLHIEKWSAAEKQARLERTCEDIVDVHLYTLQFKNVRLERRVDDLDVTMSADVEKLKVADAQVRSGLMTMAKAHDASIDKQNEISNFAAAGVVCAWAVAISALVRTYVASNRR